MSKQRTLLTLLILMAAATPAKAGPLGLEMGMPLSRLSIQQDLGDNRYVVKVPTPNSEFESYIAFVTVKEGLCKISAIGKTHENDKAGTSTRIAYERLKAVLRDKYGPSKTYDFLHAGSIWKESYEWAASIYRNERSLADFWDREEHSNLTDNLTAIALSVKAVGLSNPYLILNYEFKNLQACDAVNVQRDNDAL